MLTKNVLRLNLAANQNWLYFRNVLYRKELVLLISKANNSVPEQNKKPAVGVYTMTVCYYFSICLAFLQTAQVFWLLYQCCHWLGAFINHHTIHIDIQLDLFSYLKKNSCWGFFFLFFFRELYSFLSPYELFSAKYAVSVIQSCLNLINLTADYV